MGFETNEKNRAGLEIIQSSCFLVCFDDEEVNGEEANVAGG